MTTQTIDIPEEQARFMRDAVATGRFRDESEVVRAALQLLEQEEEEYRENLETLRAEVQMGMDDIEAGRYTELNSREEIEAFGREVARRGMERLTGAANASPTAGK